MDNLNWDEYFMALSKVSAMRSKDPNTKVGATLVDKRNRVIGLGYNGMPAGNDDFPWGREGKLKETKYPYVVHAEPNALLNSTKSTIGSKIYVSLFPCSNCAKLLVQAGVREVVYEDDKYDGVEDNMISKNILNKSGVKVRRINPIKIVVN